MRRLQSLAWVTLAYNVAVVLWGAGVRATGSGAGCGSHWPLCNGEVVPRAPSVQTVIELTHRATSGLALLLVLALVVAVFRSRSQGHPARAGAVWSLVFILAEAAVGAGLVLLHLVGQNQSLGRAAFMAVHLVNTFFLLGALALTVHWCGDGAAVKLRGRGSLGTALLVSLGGLMLVGASGAVAALGDTLFPSSSWSAALGQDLSATAHVFVRLRLLHPFIAIAVAGALLTTCYRVVQREGADSSRRATWTAALVLAQLIAGLVNVALLAPVWMQIVHLLLADLVWISLVLLAATVLAADRVRESARAA